MEKTGSKQNVVQPPFKVRAGKYDFKSCQIFYDLGHAKRSPGS